MRRRISLKLGMLFFILMILIELSLFFVLYTNISNHQIDEVLDGLLARGGSHRNVLEKNFDQGTLNHVVLMESEAETDVVITDEKGQILSSSSILEEYQRELIESQEKAQPDQGRIIESEWKTEPYVATLSPIVRNGNIEGYVYMFSPSTIIRNLTSHLSQQFIFVMILTLLVTLIVVFTLSKLITKPLIRMKEETEKLSRGETTVELDDHYKDELGVLARSINRLAEDLERMKQERNDFLSSIAHELRTPLTYLKGYADIASREETNESDRQNYLMIIKEESENLTTMIKQLFYLAQMDENTFTIHPERCELKSLLAQAEESIYPFVNKREAEISIDCPSDLYVYADPVRFKQVIVNILDNAIRYSGEHPVISIEVVDKPDTCEIRLKDQGPGVPEEALPYLFERLYRTDKSRSRDYGGTGLGLAIVKEIVDMHGGKVEARNEQGLLIVVNWPKEGRV
ncbi:Signal transduction histidine kinase [Halobacillus alkaliphilus]|uniref:histidine kinase n=1 Tax=Halobacillus alkaliphilus TaxID=396056 RepID=A0A1I2JWD1_9BACI|nr:sensor histidine kinase [Halobacillus alkaliphilus]SFF59145.1 Signal transduction histidine kinase [Halobacillus alkaliphilus]